MSAKNVLTQLNQIVDAVPLENILEVAETVACVMPIPGLPFVIKILKWSVKLRPVTTKAIGTSVKFIEGMEDVQRTRRNEMVDNMIAIACEDGIIDDDEETFLRSQAVKLGENPDEFMQRVRARLS